MCGFAWIVDHRMGVQINEVSDEVATNIASEVAINIDLPASHIISLPYEVGQNGR